MKDLSFCHIVAVKVEHKGDEALITCTKCKKKCDVFHGTKSEAEKHGKSLKSK